MKRFDKNGHRLNLLFSGKDSFKTRMGGVVSILINIVVCYYAYGKIKKLAYRKDPAITTTQQNVAIDGTINLTDNHFDWMFIISKLNEVTENFESVKVPASIGSFRMYR